MASDSKNLRWVLLGIGMLLALPCLWIGAHHARPLGSPRWTAADLSRPPPAADNAWTLLASASVPVPTDDLDMMVSGRGATPFTEVWQLADEHSLALRAHVRRGASLRDDFASRPRFVPAHAPQSDSWAIPAMQHYRSRHLAVLSMSLEQAEGPAYAEAESMWRMALDYASHCRDALTCAVGLAILDTSLNAAQDLSLRPTAPERKSALADVLAEADIEALSATPGVIGEYISTRMAIEASGALLTDRTHTDALAVRSHERLVSYCESPGGPPPALVAATEHPLYWLYNPGGKLLLETLSPEMLESVVTRFHADRDELVRKQRRVVEALRARSRAEGE